MSGKTPTNDPHEYIQLVPNSDGTISITRQKFPETSPNPDPTSSTPVLSKDIPINEAKNTWARIFLPKQALIDQNYSSSPKNKKKTKKKKKKKKKLLPLLVYFHGGGFIILSAASTVYHDFCFNIAAEVSAVVVSIEYRLAPEHRLPAAYEDGMEALHWINTTQDLWLRDHADYSQCYVMGTSAGGNIAYNVGLRAADEADRLVPLKIRGLILHHPFFGGLRRTQTEMESINRAPALPEVLLLVEVNDLMWDLCLPDGVDRDHMYCNPMALGGSKLLETMKLLGCRVLVTGCSGDILIDRLIELVKLMKEKGVQVFGHFSEGEYHAVEVLEPSKARSLHVALRAFLQSSCMADMAA